MYSSIELQEHSYPINEHAQLYFFKQVTPYYSNVLELQVNVLSKALEKGGSKVFDAASSPIRMQMLRLLTAKGALTYTEIMFSLKLDPVRDAGKFVYHLKTLQEASLIVFDKDVKKYSLTELGGIIVNFARDIEEYVTVRKGRLFVRTSKLTIEEFDRNKIIRSLMVEAGIPYELAEEIAVEAEDRFIRLKTTYLTAPLIREFVNAILIERKLEEYRHKLTRLGMPVYDVTQSLKKGSERMLDVESVRKAAGSSVMEEYVLLACLPREISDAHMSGQLHINNLADWILKPSEFQHDLRYFLRNGLLHVGPPKNFSSALAIARDLYQLSFSEVSSEQSFDMFNVLLAPYMAEESEDRVVESLELFIQDIQTIAADWTDRPGLSLGYEFSIPKFLGETDAIGPQGRVVGKYEDFLDEAKLLLNHTIAVVNRLSAVNPITNPRFIFKIRENTLQSEQYGKELLLTHGLASNYFLPYFAYLKNEAKSNYTATGFKLTDDWTGFWETNCQRTGCVDTIFLNLPRIAYEAHKSDERFLQLLRSGLDLATKAFQTKKKYITERIQESLLPTLSGAGRGSSYIHFESSLCAISPIGLNEAVTAHVGSNLSSKSEDSTHFGRKILEELSNSLGQAIEESSMRFALANRPGDDAATRLAELDVEQYGIGSVVVQGSKKHPYYTDLVVVPQVEKISLNDRILIEAGFQSFWKGGSLLPIYLTPTGFDSEALIGLTKKLCSSGIGLFSYTGMYSICGNCSRWFRGVTPTCSFCGSNQLRYMGRSSATVKPLSLWPDAKTRTIEKLVYYSPTG